MNDNKGGRMGSVEVCPGEKRYSERDMISFMISLEPA